MEATEKEERWLTGPDGDPDAQELWLALEEANHRLGAPSRPSKEPR